MDLFDIVFEKKNKEYGAYYLKKKYVRNLLISFSITMFIALIFSGYSIAYKFYSIKPVPMPKGVVYEPTYLSVEDIAAPELPEEKPEPKIEPSLNQLNEIPIVSDSVKSVAIKDEIPKEKEEVEENKDSSSSGGRLGVADGQITVGLQRLPEFPGGEKAKEIFIQQNLKSANFLKIKRIRGVVVVSFVIRRDGRVDDIKVVRSLSPEIDQECIRVVSMMPLWTPAIIGGHPIEITHTQPFNFAF